MCKDVHPVLPSRDVPAAISFYVERPMLRFVIDDVEAFFDELKDKGVFHAQTKLRDTAWGTREFAFHDPGQNGLTIYRDL